jgi:parallel beta-helix repeat protein
MAKLLRKTVFGITASLLLISMLTLAFKVEPVKGWIGNVGIRPDGSIYPPDAPISTVDNVTYTLTDNIYGSIGVGKEHIIVDGAGYTVEGPGEYPSWGISLGGSNVTIKNFVVKKFERGIYLDNSIYCRIEGNTLINNTFGINILWSNNNIISGNVFVNDGLAVGGSYDNIVVNNLVNGKPLVYLENVSDYMVEDAGQVVLVNCSGITVKNLNLSNTAIGVQLWNTNNTNIAQNDITNNFIGILMDYASNNSIQQNNIANNTGGILMESAGYFNTIQGNTMTNNNWGGVALLSSAFTIISGNVFVNDGLFTVPTPYENTVVNNLVNGKPLVYLENQSDYVVGDAGQVILVNCNRITVENLNLSNTITGVYLWQTNNTIISENNIRNNGVGVYLVGSSNNTVSGNNITNSRIYGVYFYYKISSNNRFYHNNFVDNAKQVYAADAGWGNMWNDNYPLGGNYWSDYTDVDLCHGPYQNQTGSDAIWDHPYIIDEDNADLYPLVNPWTPISIYVQGIDVSHHQGDINWSKVYGAGYKFAFVKATGGVNFTDPNFIANMEQASQAGLIVGAYHFAYPEYNNAVSEAQHFLNVAGNYMKTGYLRPVLDLEDDPTEDSYPYRMGKENLTNWIHTWMNTVKNETGIEPIIYTGWYARVGDYLDDSIAEYNLWIADWTYDPAISPDTGIWESWDFWQYSNKGSIPGIAGDVDLDLFNGYMQRLYDAFTIPNVKVFNVVWENKTYPITVYSNSTVTHLVFNQTQAQISFNITGSHGSKGYCNITIPKDLLKGPWTYTMDGETPSVIDISEDENATHSFIYFTYIHASTFRITIQGAWVVPEFPSTIILPLFMLTTLIATVLLKKKRKNPNVPKFFSALFLLLCLLSA